MGHLGEEVVDDVEVSDTVEEEVSLPAEEVPVDGRSGTAGVAPGITAVVGDDGVGVVQVGDHDEPVSHQEPGDTVHLEDHGTAPDIAGALDEPAHRDETDVGEDDEGTLILGEEDGGRCIEWIRLEV